MPDAPHYPLVPDMVAFSDDPSVLDGEMATIGDPLMDLGGALAYWVQADDDELFRLSKRQPSDLPGMPTRAEIVQQISLRFSLGQTTNPAFQDLGHFATYLETRCRTVAGLG